MKYGINVDPSGRRLFPGGKRKAFVLTYDDGTVQDARFVELLKKYGLKATFNLNSGLMKSGFEWTHECGMRIKRLSYAQAAELYGDNEIASHSFSHPYLHELPYERVKEELAADKAELEALFGREVRGFALPFITYNDIIKRCAEDCGFEYSRISDEGMSYAPESDYFALRAGIFHLSPKFDSFFNGFLNTGEELATCMIVGHTYDLDVYGLWDKTERVLKTVSESPDCASMTVIEYIEYIKAIRAANFDGTNSTNKTLWFERDGKVCSSSPGEAFI